MLKTVFLKSPIGSHMVSQTLLYFITYTNEVNSVELLADQAANYQKPHTSTKLGVEGRLLWKLTTLHVKLYTACAEGNKKLVRFLLNKASRIHTESRTGWSGLHWASNNGCASLLSLLVEKGGNISLQDRNGWSPLIAAARNQQDEVVSMLLDHGADIDAETNSDSTALHLAVERGTYLYYNSSSRSACRYKQTERI